MYSYYNQLNPIYKQDTFNKYFYTINWSNIEQRDLLNNVAINIRKKQDYGAFLDSIDLILPNIDLNYYFEFKGRQKIFCDINRYNYNKHLIEFLSRITHNKYSIKDIDKSKSPINIGFNPFKSTSFIESMAQTHIISIINENYNNISQNKLTKLFIN
jgi:hypothetical protein